MSITVGNVGSAPQVTTLSYTCNGDTLVVFESNATGGGGLAPSGVTFNGVAMTLVIGVIGGTYFGHSAWILTAAPNVTANIVVSGTGGQAFYGLAGLSFTGVDQSTPNRTGSTDAQVGGGIATVTPTSQTGDLIVGANHGNSTTQSEGTQTNQFALTSINGQTSMYGDTKAGTSGAFLTWTETGTAYGQSASVAFALIPAAAGDTLLGQILT